MLVRSYNIYGDHNLFFSRRTIKFIQNGNFTFQVNKFKKYNFLFGYEEFDKDNLYMDYFKMKKEFNSDFNFMSETFIYPNDKLEIEKKFVNYKLDINDLWLIKPINDFGGNGIIILNKLKEIKRDSYLLTKYITNLDLINNKKYDLRLYVLVSGLKPLRIYFNQEGLIRIATHNFTLNKNSIKDKFTHITNLGFNSKNKDFIIPNNNNTIIEKKNSNIWNLDMYRKYLEEKGVDFNKLIEKIKDIIIKAIISVYFNLTEKLSNNSLIANNYYNLLGYDILITDKFEPKLLEINTRPNLVNHADLDNIINTNVFVDTLNLVGIVPFIRNNDFKSKYIGLLGMTVKEAVDNALCELNRPRGDFELIFPLKSNINIYKKYFKNNNQENEMFWKKIAEEA